MLAGELPTSVLALGP